MSGFGYIKDGKGFILESTNNRPHAILIASTKLHLFNAIVIAKQFSKLSYHLFYIDQQDLNDPYFKSLLSWNNNPFSSEQMWITDKTSIFSKIRSKRKIIKEMLNKVNQLNPQKVIVGNDRKNEISALLNAIPSEVIVGYMDDGIHSYLPEKSSFLKYTFFDNFLKTLIYGTNITTPKHIGCSETIDEIYLYKPKFKHLFFQQTQVNQLNISLLHTQSIRELTRKITQDIGLSLDIELKGVENILFLPHPKNLQNDFLNKLSQLNTKTAVKLHPRDHTNLAFFKSHGIKVVEHHLVAELIFLGLKKDLKIFGFESSALLMAKWLRPTLEVFSLKFDNNNLSTLELLMQENEVTILPITDLYRHLKT